MKIIDCHLHICRACGPVLDASKRIGASPTIQALKAEMKKHGVVGGVLISSGDEPDIARDLSSLKRISSENESLKCVLGVNPAQARPRHLEMLDKAMGEGLIDGIKVFPSYFPTYPNDRVYHKFYRLCIKHGLPAIIHSGAVIKSTGKRIYQKYAHPLYIDELAVDFPGLRIVVAHSGYPWIIDAAQIAHKNENVFLDLSGLREGPIDKHDELDKHWIAWLFDYLDDETKIMYGSDWPIVRMGEYIAWLKKSVPKRLHKAFFHENAKRFFGF